MSNGGKSNLLVRRWEHKFLKHLINPLDLFNLINKEFASEVTHVSKSLKLDANGIDTHSIPWILYPCLSRKGWLVSIPHLS